MTTHVTEAASGDRVLLVQPEFRFPSKSKNSHQSIPYGLLRIGNWMRSEEIDVRFQRGNVLQGSWIPTEIWITSMFTYWAPTVEDSFDFYQHAYPRARIVVGGILPSLSPDYCIDRFGKECVHQGLVPQAERFDADYSLLDSRPDLQVLISTRGCIRKCKFCYAWRLEGKIQPYPIHKLTSWIHKNRVVFYDNNILAHPRIEELLFQLGEVRVNGRVVSYECQSGYDGRILQKRPELVPMLKAARFRHPRIAWDGPFDDHTSIREQLDILDEGGYPSGSVQVFMLYNHDLPPKEIEKKRLKCWEWGVQVMDCRVRPLDQFREDYNPYRNQSPEDYHIHVESGWTDWALKGMRKDFRRQNIQVRYNKFPFHSKYFERKQLRDTLPVGTLDSLAKKSPETVKDVLDDAWYPDECRFIGIIPQQSLISDFC